MIGTNPSILNYRNYTLIFKLEAKYKPNNLNDICLQQHIVIALMYWNIMSNQF